MNTFSRIECPEHGIGTISPWALSLYGVERCAHCGREAVRVEYVPNEKFQKLEKWADQVEVLMNRIYQFGLTDEAADEMEALVKDRHEG
jgi:hypothetical protein